MAWQPNLSDLPHVEGSGILLNEAFQKLQSHAEGKMTDGIGMYGIITERGILVAKKYIYGNIVSAHKIAVVTAKSLNRPMIMYIGDIGKFYSFNAQKIMEQSEENKRGDVIFLNWTIKMGEPLKL
jgi:hypothetical protein